MHPLDSSVLLLLYVCPLLDMQPRNVSEEGNKKTTELPPLLILPRISLYGERKSAQTVSFCRNARGTLLGGVALVLQDIWYT